MSTPQRRTTDHLSPPSLPGQVVEAPVYVRVRPNWLERALFIAVFVQIMLTLLFLVVGSNPTRELVDSSRERVRLQCEVLHSVDEKTWLKYRTSGICR